MTTTPPKSLGILTAGGDCPGLNAVIRGLVMRADQLGYEVIGFRRGFAGLLPGGAVTKLDLDDVQGIQMTGGTILNTSHTNPFEMEDGPAAIKAAFERYNIQGAVVVGGLTNLGYAEKLYREHGLPLVGVPKTINNDVSGTDFCFGFFTAVTNATETLDRLMTFARSHEQVMVVEVKGGRSGSLAYYAGIAGGANAILVPEQPFTAEEIVQVVKERRDAGYASSLIVVSEGAWPTDLSEDKRPVRDPAAVDQIRVADILAETITAKTDIPAEAMVLDKLLRSGSPAGFDRVLGMRFGMYAGNLCHEGSFGRMAASRGRIIEDIPLSEALEPTPLEPMLAVQTTKIRG